MNSKLATLASVLRERKNTVVSQWKAVVSGLAGAARLDASTLRDHIPQFLDEMITAIASRNDSAMVGKSGLGSPLAHGAQRLAAGFNIKEVVEEYNILRSAVLDVAAEAGLQLTADECRVVNRIIDDAVAGAVDVFAREQANELQRQRDEHLAFVAHDVRTPLNAISLIATMLSEQLDPESRELAEMLHSLQRNVQRIDELIHNILKEDLNQKAPGGLNLVRREIDLWPLVQQLVQDLQPVAAAAQIKIRNLVPRHLTIHADAALMGRALQNIVDNAIKFAPGGDIEIGAEANAAGMECWVKDNGTGIAPERLKSIFDKHETDADTLRAGFGLGLAIFKQIIEGHGGKITVQSQPGEGATFRFSIPKSVNG